MQRTTLDIAYKFKNIQVDYIIIEIIESNIFFDTTHCCFPFVNKSNNKIRDKK